MTGKRALFVTIGQSPRDDILSEMRPWWEAAGRRLATEQKGALDGLDPGEIARLAPSENEERLVSRLECGDEVVLGADAVKRRVMEIVGRAGAEHDFLVLLCTGRFPGLRTSRLLVEAQSVVDHGIAAFARGAARVGILLPHEQQAKTFRPDVDAAGSLVTSWASPYSGNRFAAAAEELGGADLIVMHCMGYTESHRREMEERTGTPVLLARRLVAAAIAQLL